MLCSGKNIIVTAASGNPGVAVVQRLISGSGNVLAVAGHQSGLSRLIDAKHYGQIATPVLALADERNYPYLRELLPTQASDVRGLKVNSSSYYVPEDQPKAVVRELLGFFKS
jgi:NAD(P)-dependent dehydrogenase (short-subunit alcohol dehydrogenase family)